MRSIHSTTRVDASPEVVWEVLTDLPQYGEWNLFITALHGDLRVGGRLRATFTLPGRKPRTFTPVVTVLEPGRQLTWLGRVAIPKLFDGEHTLAVEPDGAGTTFVHTERFHGLLPPVMRGLLADTHDAFRAMDSTLARRAESIAAQR